MKIRLLVLTIAMVLPRLLTAQQTELVKDINTTQTGLGLSTREQAVANNMLFMLAGNNTEGIQFWRSDGTDNGTIRLTDVNSIHRGDPSYLTGGGNYVCFVMEYEGQDWLYRSDGTREGTYRLRRFGTFASGYFDILENVKGTIYFSYSDEIKSRQLWKTNGTVAGTVLVKDFGISGSGESVPDQLFSFNEKLYFVIRNEEDYDLPAVLWQSDGTTAGTVPGPVVPRGFIRPVFMGNNIYFGEGNSLYRINGKTVTVVKDGFEWLREPLVVGQTLYFSARHTATGEELWKSDGTTSGTVLVKDINPGSANSSDPTAFVHVAGTLYFKAHDATGWKLWKSNGTAAGTVPVSNAEVSRYTFVGQNDLVAIGSKIVFPAGPDSDELWVSDGTQAGTQLLLSVKVEILGKVKNEVFFLGITRHGNQLYKTDGTVAGTVAITNRTSSEGSTPQQLTDVNGTAFFIASPVLSVNTKYELWKSNGTAAGTVKLVNSTSVNTNRPPRSFTNVNGTLYYVENDDELWKSDGTAAGTIRLKINMGSDFSRNIDYLTAVNGTLFFLMNNDVWKSDGTTAGTIRIQHPDLKTGRISSLFHAGGTIYFKEIRYAEDTLQSVVLWKTNGEPGGTILLKSFGPSFRNTVPYAFKGELYFGEWDFVNSVELWKSDGTKNGTGIIKQVISSGGNILAQPEAMAGWGNNLYYITNTSNGFLLVKTDGTAAGTTVIKNLFPGGNMKRFRLYTAMGMVYFSVYNQNAMQELLWRSDGTAAGTFQLAAFDVYDAGDPYRVENRPVQIKDEINGKLIFITYGKQSGDQVWVTDGTVKGTQMLTTVQTPKNFIIRSTVKFGNLFYFDMLDPETGTELWQTDGTAEGTHLTVEMNPDGNAIIHEMLVIGRTLLLSADDGKTGIELYKYLPPAGQDVVMPPIADAYTRNVPYEKTNFGTQPELSIKAGSLPGYQRKTYLKFPLEGISKITSAKLRIYGFNFENNKNITLAATGVSNDGWTETGINWLNAPAASGKILDSVKVSNQAKYYELDVTDFVKAQLGGDKTASFLLTNPKQDNVRLYFMSRESKTNPPQLVIENQSSSAARIAAFTEPEKRIADDSYIYPNPVKDHFFIKISDKHQGHAQLLLTQLNGQTRLLRQENYKAGKKTMRVDVSDFRLPAGKYLLRVKSEKEEEVVQMIVSE
ncbi:ELWxxDGT repeat protein [Dyadobacter sediminis]|uniref:DNRLRE domain-containing protein n=1 Tax=Dyadobacter sediminis TaxID=1493691 RepID=A0A5R9KJI6_9BACT|nr:ELWxxDGT repeat protein [Dyadobacter sediminis]TLU96388.1 DNRLRE domain-containing protein [Dyadobacter sediminis]GGB81827.1 hypothetical protein GCM10011325_06650 [Dyadobacter sediminis]